MNLTDEEKKALEDCATRDDYVRVAKEIKAKGGGSYPKDWYQVVLAPGGISERLAARWADPDAFKMSVGFGEGYFEPPKPVDGVQKVLTLTGMLVPFFDGQPVLLEVPASEFLYMPVFKDETSLKEVLALTNTEFDRIVQIEEQHEFLESIPPSIKIAVNPNFQPNGRVRWTEVQR